MRAVARRRVGQRARSPVSDARTQRQPIDPPVVLGEQREVLADVALHVGQASSQVSSSPGRGRRSRPRTPTRARGGPDRASVARRSSRRPHHAETGEQVVGGQVLERGEASADHAHLLDRRRTGRHHRTRRRPCAGRGRRPARPAGAPDGGRGTSRPSTRRGRARRRAAPSPRRREAGRARRGRGPARARPMTYSALRREKPSRDELGLRRLRQAARASGTHVYVPACSPVALDQPVADREGRRAARPAAP